MKLLAASLVVILLSVSSNGVHAMSCTKAKKHLPDLTMKQRAGARQFYQNERRHALGRGSQHRTEAEIASMFRKLMQIEDIAKYCGIPLKDISPQRYFELTGHAL